MELSPAELNKIHLFLGFLGISEDKVVISPEGDTINITVAVPEDEAGIYIGRFAATIDSIQLLISLIINRGDSHRHILLDIGGYRLRRAATLSEMVKRISAEVSASGLARALPPISATERRLVHLLLSDHETLTTYSEGTGSNRRLYISPKT